MKRLRKKNFLNKLDDAINDKIVSAKAKKKEKKLTKNNEIYDYEVEKDNVKRINFEDDIDNSNNIVEDNIDNIEKEIDNVIESRSENKSYDEIDIDEKRNNKVLKESKEEKKKFKLFKRKREQ